jgi:hypothetical protein
MKPDDQLILQNGGVVPKKGQADIYKVYMNYQPGGTPIPNENRQTPQKNERTGSGQLSH